MNILFLAHRIPFPPNKGDKVRSYHELAHLARRHDVWCACFVDDPADLRYVNALRELCRDVAAVRLFKSIATPRALWNLATGGTLTEGYYQHLRMLDTLRRWDSDVAFDAVLVFSSGMAPYAGHVHADRKVIDFCDLDSRKWLAYSNQATGAKARLLGIEATRLARRELQWLDAFDAAVVITEVEAADLADTPLRHKVHVIGNGVEIPRPRGDECLRDEVRGRDGQSSAGQHLVAACDGVAPDGVTHDGVADDDFAYDGDARDRVAHDGVFQDAITHDDPIPGLRDPSPNHRPRTTNRPEMDGHVSSRPVVGFVGCMDYPPNVDAVRWFVQDIWPWIIKEIPDALFQIVGRNPTRAVRALADPTVEVVGEVDRVFPYLCRFRVSVSPIRVARGLQNKVLEAMVAARPVVLTSAAATGIDGRDGEHFLVADDARPFADHVVALLGDSTRRACLGQAARLFASGNHCWDREMTRLESLLTAPAHAGKWG